MFFTQSNVDNYNYPISSLGKSVSEFNQDNFDYFMESIITNVIFFPGNKQLTIEFESNFIDKDNPLKLTLYLDLDSNGKQIAKHLNYVGKTFKQARSELLELESQCIKRYEKSVEYFSIDNTLRLRTHNHTIDGSI